MACVVVEVTIRGAVEKATGVDVAMILVVAIGVVVVAVVVAVVKTTFVVSVG